MIYSRIYKIYHVCQVKDEIKIKQYHIYDKCYIYNIIVYDILGKYLYLYDIIKVRQNYHRIHTWSVYDAQYI